MKNLPVFVYGTLKKGFNNHHYLDKKYTNMETGTVKGELYNCGYYPALVHGSEEVLGEIYYVDENKYDLVIDNLDCLEGFNRHDPEYSLYLREEKEVITATGEKVLCFVYIYNRRTKNLKKLDKEFKKTDGRGIY